MCALGTKGCEVDHTTWYSYADWGDYDVFNGYKHNITHDRHGSKESAEGVTWLLRRNGFGGDRKVFPARVWVSQTPPEEIGNE